MSSSIPLANIYTTMPLAPEESWLRISPKSFFLASEPVVTNPKVSLEIKQISNTAMQDLLSTHLNANIGSEEWDALLTSISRTVFVSLMGDLVIVHTTQANLQIDIYTEQAKLDVLIDGSKICENLNQRLAANIGQTLVMKVKANPDHVPLLIVEPASKKESYSCVKIETAQNSELELIYLLANVSDFSMHRHELLVAENSKVSEAWIVKNQNKTGAPSTCSLERLVTLKSNATLVDAHVFIPQGVTKVISRIVYDGQNSESISSTAIKATGDSKLDFEPIQEHKVERSKSSLKAKILVDDSARAIFQGLIRVERNAPKCVALQENKNLILSKKARIEATPRLEIYPDEVMCKHGSATGEIDGKKLYYLETRGFSNLEARQMIIDSFIYDGLSALPPTSLLRIVCENWLR